LQLGASKSAVGILHSCTSLTKLVIDILGALDWHEDPAGSPAHTTAAAQLQHLQLQMSDFPEMDEVAWSARVVPYLTGLTHLQLARGPAFERLAAHISSMVKLQELSILHPYLLQGG
jgi:hypothetical protein